MDNMSPPALRCAGVAKSYRRMTVLHDASLEVGAGECVGLVGVNGAGKTSLLRCVLDLVAVDRGTIEIFGIDHRQPTARAALAFLPERFAPPWYMTGAEFIRHLLRLHGLAPAPAGVEEALRSLELDREALQRQVRHYSKGMTQKLGLAAFLLIGKPLCVLDEPASGLDPKARALFKDALRGLGRQGRAVLFTSHNLQDVEELCDRIVVLHGGHVRFSGTPSDCRARYDAGSLEQAFLRCFE
ncbi:ABC transporter ATP-binding protein [Zemynaea arenosa]|nr:ABC transporter ATP-binding protein [Massilia arenosa]